MGGSHVGSDSVSSPFPDTERRTTKPLPDDSQALSIPVKEMREALSKLNIHLYRADELGESGSVHAWLRTNEDEVSDTSVYDFTAGVDLYVSKGEEPKEE